MLLGHRHAALLLAFVLASPAASIARGDSNPLGADLQAARSPVLPPVAPWHGKSRALEVSPNDPWVTPCEASGMTRTPRYDETMSWLRRLCDAAPELEMVSFGKSLEGRDLWMVIATRAGGFSPEALHAGGRPVVLAQAGIHSGEIDGKDAGMMLLRDMTVRGTKRELLDRASLIFVPILNVDGHERFSAFSRINQRGPVECGWRTTARNLNLNRDYTKLDAPEMRAVVQALTSWDPDLYLDLHVTDGVDYQYDVTWGYNGAGGWSPQTVAWLDRVLTPAIRAALQDMGHIPGPFVWPVDDRDLSLGIYTWLASPRLSNGYGDARHLPTVLVENHSLKPYEQRVLGTYVLLESALRVLGEQGQGLRRAAQADRDAHPAKVTLDWSHPKESPQRVTLLGIESRLVPSTVSGALRVEWTGKPVTLHVPNHVLSEPSVTAARPRAYWIPAQWKDLAERLAQHGIGVERIEKPRELDVEMLRIVHARLDTVAYEGHVRVGGVRVERERRHETFGAGSVRVPTDQPLGDLAVLLLEPESPDSYFQWGFFPELLQRTEYVEAYVMEPTAERMLAESPELRAEFTRKLMDDPAFAASPEQRLQWFYRRTPFFDATWGMYSVARETSVEK